MRKWLGIGVISTALVVAGGIWVHAQNPHVLPSPPTLPNPRLAPPIPIQPPPQIISGADIGFRVDAWDGDTPTGKLVVRHEGKWVELRISPSARRLTAR